MRKALLSCAMMFVATVSWAGVGDDLTAKYLRNADFSQTPPVEGRICTYDYDMEKTGSVLFGQQAVDGWDCTKLSDNTFVADRTDGLNACASGVFAIGAYNEDYEHTAELGGTYFAPDFNSKGKEASGHALGLVAVWSANVQYTQQVTLPVGAYTIQLAVYNSAGTSAVNENLCGFIAESGEKYLMDNRSWEVNETWQTYTVTFVLKEETTGVISVGYAAAGAGSAAMPHLFIDEVKLIEADPVALDRQQAALLKDETLLPLLEAGDELGVSTKDGWAVYNNADATLAEVQAAIENQKALNAAGMTDFTDFFINNAHFALGTPQDNGICTYDYDREKNGTTYFGMQPVQDWTPSEPGTNGKAAGLFAVGSGETAWLGAKNAGFVAPQTKTNGATEGNVFGFVSCWSSSANYTQQVTLPAGSYTITIPTYNSTGGTSAIAKNLCGFIADSGEEYLAETTVFPVNTWSMETIKFQLEEETSGVISIGYAAANAGSAAMPHLFIDEFTLMYNGTTAFAPSLIALNGAIRNGENYLFPDDPCQASLLQELEDALDTARALKDNNSADADANLAATTAINNAITAIKSSIQQYARFNDFLEGALSEAIQQFAEGDMVDFSVVLQDERDAYQSRYADGDLTAEEIDSLINGLQPRILEIVKTKLAEFAAIEGDHENNLDISLLFENLSFENRSTAGWTAQFTSGKFESQQNGVLEVWSGSAVDFTASTTLADLPAGVYEITAPAWFRDADDVSTGYDHYQSNELVGAAYLFANGNKVLLRNQGELLSEEQNDVFTAKVADGFLPNGQATAQRIFYDKELDVNVNNTVVTALSEPGDLTIGFKGDGLENGTWTVWGAMKVVYKGANADAVLKSLDGEIADLQASATRLMEDDLTACVEESVTRLTQAVDGGDAALEEADLATKQEAVAELKAALEYAAASKSLVEKMMDQINLYIELAELSEIKSTDTQFEDMLNSMDPESGVESNERIEENLAALPLAWTAYVCAQPGMATATEKAPVDVTPAILNPGFEGITGMKNGTEAWSVTKEGGNEGYEHGVYEFYNNANFDIHQTIQGLTPGYYRVMVQGAYRYGGNAENVAKYQESADSAGLVSLYAGGRSVALKNILELQDDLDNDYTAGMNLEFGGEAVVQYGGGDYYVPNNRSSMMNYFQMEQYWNTVDCYVGEEGVLTLGLRKEVGQPYDWCPFDNFQLLYLGTTAPTAISDIQATAAQPQAIYDLQGRRVSRMGKGLYIIGGKKVLK